MNAKYSKNEKLKSKKKIEQLFNDGCSVSTYPLRLIYLQTPLTESYTSKVAVSVSKRNFKKATDRNQIKRLLREAYRQNKHAFLNNIKTPYSFMILYLSKDGTSFDEVTHKMKHLFDNFLSKVSQ